jgi:hypothetical protein
MANINPYVNEHGMPKLLTARQRRILRQQEEEDARNPPNQRPNEPPSGPPRDASPNFAAGMQYGELLKQKHAKKDGAK